jgi:hypothetical protein
MNTIPRSALLQMLGWAERQENEGILKWSKPTEDMLSCLCFSVSQTPEGIKASLDFDGVDEDFESKVRPIMRAEFVPFGAGSMKLAAFKLDGVDAGGAEGGFEKALEACAQAKAGFQGKPKAMLLADPMPGAKPGKVL